MRSGVTPVMLIAACVLPWLAAEPAGGGTAAAPAAPGESPKGSMTAPADRAQAKPVIGNGPAEARTPRAQVNRLFSEALVLLKNNQPIEARKLLQQALSLTPNDAAVHCNLGLAYQNSGHMHKAMNEFLWALQLKPGMPEATLNLAGCYQSLGETPRAIEWYQRYLEENPGAADAVQVADIISALRASLAKPGSDPRLPDYFESIVGEGVYRWPASALPLRVYISKGDGVSGFRPVFRGILESAFRAWVAASGHRLSYVLVGDRAQASVVCDWTGDPAEVGEAGTQSERGMAHVFATGSEIKRATLKVLTRPILHEGTLSDEDMKKACLHEVGHVLGLQGHSSNNHDIMFFTVDTPTVWPLLSRRDKATILRLYHDYPQGSGMAPAD